MILCVDCFKLVKGTGKSIGIYNLTLNLVRNLMATKSENDNQAVKACKVIVFGNPYNREDFDIPGVQFVMIKYNPLDKRICVLWELYLVSIYCKKYKVDRVVFPRGFLPLRISTENSIIIHDLIPFYYDKYYPGFFNKYENAYIMWRLKASILKTHQVITISEASKKDILSKIKVSEEKIRIIHNGLNDMSFIPETKQEKNYIIAITSSLPHKNAEGIFKSYMEYCKIAKNPIDLKVVGVEDCGKLTLPEDIKANIQCYKYIEKNSDLYQLISNAKVFLFLSLVEGFGFPPIEAMHLGVPVICSNESSLPEIMGDSGVLVPPTDYEAVARSLMKLIGDDALKKSLIEKGYENIRRFTWESRASLYWEALSK